MKKYCIKVVFVNGVPIVREQGSLALELLPGSGHLLALEGSVKLSGGFVY